MKKIIIFRELWSEGKQVDANVHLGGVRRLRPQNEWPCAVRRPSGRQPRDLETVYGQRAGAKGHLPLVVVVVAAFSSSFFYAGNESAVNATDATNGACLLLSS